MTAIYAFSSPDAATSAIIADDVEFCSQSKVNKIHLVNDRYAIAIYGQDALLQGIEAITLFQGTDKEINFDKIDDLATAIAKYTALAVPHMNKLYTDAVSRGELSQRDWDIVLSQHAFAAAIDLHTHTVYRIEFGACFPRMHLTPKVFELQPDIIHRFALAEKGLRDDDKINEQISESYLLSKLKHLLIQDKQFIKEIGNPGTIVYSFNKNTIYRTAFSSPEDFITTTWARSFLGFRLNILVT